MFSAVVVFRNFHVHIRIAFRVTEYLPICFVTVGLERESGEIHLANTARDDLISISECEPVGSTDFQ